MVNKEDLKTLVETSVINALRHAETPKPQNVKRYYTRKDLTVLFCCSLGTIDNWTAKGKLQAYAIGSRVLYLVDEVHASLVKL